MWQKQQDWFWEGNVQGKIADFLIEQGYVVKTADTLAKSTGADIIATGSETKIIIEVKGWPSKNYADGDKQGQKKRTHPTNQAKHWLAEALFAIIRRKNECPDHILAIGLPEFERYQTLLADIDWALKELSIQVYFVTNTGKVYIH